MFFRTTSTPPCTAGAETNKSCSTKGTHNADSIIESKVIYYLEQCGLRV